MRLGHARGRACAKTKKVPCIFLASPPPTPPPRSGKRNGKEIFWFASPFQSPKRAILFKHFCLLFSTPSRRPRRNTMRFALGRRQIDMCLATHPVRAQQPPPF